MFEEHCFKLYVAGEVKSDVVDPISTFSYAKIDGVDPAKSELVFVANQIPPLGIQSYLVKKTSSEVKKSDKLQSNDVFKFGDEVYRVFHF